MKDYEQYMMDSSYYIKADPNSNVAAQTLRYFMVFCQLWIAGRATRSNLTNPQTFPLSNGLRCTLELIKDYGRFGANDIDK